MYDGRSLARLLVESGFVGATVMPAGTTNIPDPGSLDLEERSEESVYVEAMQRLNGDEHKQGYELGSVRT